MLRLSFVGVTLALVEKYCRLESEAVWYTIFGSQIRRDYPLNLSILLSGGKETNQDSLSSGERSGMRPRWKSLRGVVIWVMLSVQ